jgi:hypothetical protein
MRKQSRDAIVFRLVQIVASRRVASDRGDACYRAKRERDPSRSRLPCLLRSSRLNPTAELATKQVLLELGRVEEARDESRRAATMTRNECERALLLRRGEIPDRLNRC